MSTKYERELRKILEKYNFFVIRSAGSKSIDLISVLPLNKNAMPDRLGVFFIEEKSTHKEKFYVTKREETKDQYDMNKRLNKQYGIFVYYAIRYISNKKEKIWEVYEPDYNSDDYPVFRKGEGTSLMDWIDSL